MKRRRRKDPGESVGGKSSRGSRRARVVAAEAWVTVHADREGAIRVALIVANFGRKNFSLDDLRLSHVRVGPTHLSDPRALIDERGLVVPGRGVARVFGDFRMGGDDIARLRRGFEPAPNPSSSPKVDMELAGHLVLKRRARTYEVPFLLDHLPVAWTIHDDAPRSE